MKTELYNFFENPRFDRCFFSGDPVTEEEKISVFPEWILDRYQLRDKWMGMLNWNRVKYGDLFLPCSELSAIKVGELEHRIKNAFESGYDEVEKLDESLIFLWMSKIVLGILYHDIQYSIELGRKRAKPYRLSALLTSKFSQLHFMLQSLVKAVTWTVKPFSLVIKKLNYSKDIFNFRDETHNLNFSLGMNGFGIIACLQDQGINLKYQESLLSKIGNSPLHAIQFEELCARFVYSNYLLCENMSWEIKNEEDTFVMSPANSNATPRFNNWDDKMYASALQGYWEPWGLDPKDIYTFPDSPLSFLVNETTDEFITPDEISLPT